MHRNTPGRQDGVHVIDEDTVDKTIGENVGCSLNVPVGELSAGDANERFHQPTVAAPRIE